MIVVHDGDMDLDWQRLGKALQATRRHRTPKVTQEQAAAELGVSRSVIQNIERGIGFDKPTPTIREYARLLGWADGSIDRVLAGGESTLASDPAVRPEGQLPALSGLPVRIQHELEQDGELVDSIVISLPGGGSAVVVVKNPTDATPEQRQRNLDAWLSMQPKLRSLDYSDADESSPAANGV